MKLEGTGTPNLGKSAAGSRSDMVTVMPAADPCETTFVTVKVDNNFTMDNPDHHDADAHEPPPTRTPKWSSQESLAKVEQLSRLFPDKVCSDSSSACADDEHGNGCPESTSDRGRSDGNSSGEIADGSLGGDGSEERTAEQRRRSFPSSRKESTETIPGHVSPLQVTLRVVRLNGARNLPHLVPGGESIAFITTATKK